jgi:nucleoside kinase
MNKRFDLVVSGYCSMDRIIRIEQPVRTGHTSIITNPNSNTVTYGGCSVNVSVLLGMLGHQALPILRVGDDYETIGFKDFLKRHNVPRDAIKKIPRTITSHAYLIEDQDLDHVTLFHPGAMDQKHVTDPDPSWFQASKLALMTVASLSDNRFFLEQTKRANIPLAFGMKQDDTAFPKDFLKTVINETTILFANASEKDAIKKLYGIDHIKDLFDKTKLKTIIITLGKKGVRSYVRHQTAIETTDVSALKVKKVVDTVGAGDAFIAGYLSGYLKGLSERTALEYGTTMASFIIEGHGCTENAPNLTEFLKRHTFYQKEYDT